MQILHYSSSETGASDIRLVGHYQDEPPSTHRQVILRRMAKATDLSMKKGQANWELEIFLPPLTYAVFVDIVAYAPGECLFDRSEAASEFQIGYVFSNSTRTLKSTFCLK